MQLYRGDIVKPDTIIEDGVVIVENGKITYAGAANESEIEQTLGKLAPALPQATNEYLLPGFVDIHNHGGGGASFPDCTTADEVKTAAAEHLKNGTTTLIASMVTAAKETLLKRAALLADVADEGIIAGIHCEGPFCSYQYRGAQSPEYLIPGDPQFVHDLAKAARGYLRTMTVAPEIPGVAGPGGAAEALIAEGAIPSLGHTGATVEQAEQLIKEVTAGLAGSGRRMTVTHLFNGMPPMHHRSPGPVAACLAAAGRGGVVVELVADGIHLDPGTVRSVHSLVGGENVAFVTDAMAATGMADGAYVLGPMAVVVKSGVARLKNTENPDDWEAGAIAGGTAHLIDEVRLATKNGLSLPAAVRSASLTPATALGFTEVGALEAGRKADIIRLDKDLNILEVIKS
ncbi:MAG: amidohydrolase family protein [Cellulomonadaceae bacterium]|jgi:N-acetylglucosamine-6-phosphate deacetylase|nr:amidohydrolase family protein [Cellulomonadaceae bacterium]